VLFRIAQAINLNSDLDILYIEENFIEENQAPILHLKYDRNLDLI